MTPNRREFEKQCAFQKFCKSVLHNEACNTHEEIRRRRVREVTFSNLALHEERQLYTVDKYFQDEKAEPSYQMAGKEITPKLLLEAIRALPEERDVYKRQVFKRVNRSCPGARQEIYFPGFIS